MSAVLQQPRLLESRYIAELEQTVATELRLLRLLHEQLLQQREAVGRGEADAINETVHGVGRVLQTLEEARRRRQQLCEVLLADPATPPALVPDALALAPDSPLRRSITELLEYAEVVARSISVNRRLLNGALRTGQELIRVLQGEPRGGVTYERENTLAARGAVLNRSI